MSVWYVHSLRYPYSRAAAVHGTDCYSRHGQLFQGTTLGHHISTEADTLQLTTMRGCAGRQCTAWHTHQRGRPCFHVMRAVASEQMQRVAAAIRQATSSSQPQLAQQQQHPPSQPASGLEGRPLQLHLGAFPLIEQQFTVRSSQPAVSWPREQPAPTTAQQFVLIAPADVDQVMDVYMEHDLLDSDPYWCRTWPSAIALAAEILARPSLVAGKRVADLGCGLGLAGLAAACAGAAEVVLLDREPLALQCGLLSALATAGHAVQVEGLRTHPQSHSSSATPSSSTPSQSPHYSDSSSSRKSPPAAASVQHSAAQHTAAMDRSRAHPSQYVFQGQDLRRYLGQGESNLGQEGTASCTASGTSPGTSTNTSTVGGPGQRCRVTSQTFDWNAGPEPLVSSGGRFDVVLACDVLYESEAVEPIAKLVPGILKPSGGMLLLADPPNRTAHHRQRFLELLAQAADNHRASAAAGGAQRAVNGRAARLVLEECRVVDGCRTTHLDNEMLGGMTAESQHKEEVVPVQLAVFRASLGTDTVGIKMG